MSTTVGGLWLTLAGLDEPRARRCLDVGSGTITVNLPLKILSDGAAKLAIVSTGDRRVVYVAVVTGTTRAGDLERKVIVGPVRQLPNPVSADSLVKSLPPQLRRHALQPTVRVVPVPPKTWQALLADVARIGRLPERDLYELRSSLEARQQRYDDASDVVVLERDALATALEIYGGSAARKTYIGNAVGGDEAPFIQRLRHRTIKPIEDQMIDHDLRSFPGALSMKSTMVGAVKIETTRGTLTIINANRGNIEHTLGVDLVYYNHRYKSFAMVQYKRMIASGRDSEAVYRPNSDRSYANEIARMNSFIAASKVEDMTLEAFRMLAGPFYFKLCKTETPGSSSGRMLQGMYFPFVYWKLLVESPSALGRRGGLAVGFDNAQRWFTNAQFTGLLAQGWVGTFGMDTTRVEDQIVASLDSGNSVLGAFHEPDRRVEDYARDDYGRFAEWDDESAI